MSVKGPKGTLNLKRHHAIDIKQNKEQLVFERSGNDGPIRAAHGLMRALVNNMLTGVTKGFERQLEINGVGYKAEIKGNKVTLSLGYSHPIRHAAGGHHREGRQESVDPVGHRSRGARRRDRQDP